MLTFHDIDDIMKCQNIWRYNEFIRHNAIMSTYYVDIALFKKILVCDPNTPR